jgi:RNA polymerase sigma factor (sigma-70 family)
MEQVETKNDTNETDRELVQKVLRGDSRAFGNIIKSTEGLVAGIVFKMIRNAADRKDMAQDIYLKVYNKLATFKFQAKLSTWIAQISYNTCLDYLRKKKLMPLDDFYRGHESGEHTGIKEENIPGMITHETEPLVFRKELSGILAAEIDKLSPVQKTLISLYHNEELSYEEIAIITGLPEGTMKNYLFRARKALRDGLLMNYKKEEL